ncbi:hypothetical protein ACH5AL_03920 [Actinacidiphila glaucinigra]|uniref:DinB/UmuC family translesion DNA polymerase n=1 Tax=Actinacidiphila glaucinigra TaxID=235986 RepID=UPI003798858E
MICSSCCDAPTSPPRKRSPRPTPSSTPTALTVRPPSRPRLSHTGSPAPRRGPRPAGHGGIRVLPDHLQAVRAFLDPLPVGELYGVGPIQAATLEQYGLSRGPTGQPAPADHPADPGRPGGAAGAHAGTRHRFTAGHPVRVAAEHQRPADPGPRTLDPYLVRTEVPAAVVDLADQLRERHQVAQGITLGVSCSGGGSASRSRTLAEPSAFPDDLRDTAMVRTSRTGAGPGARSIPLSVHAPSADCKGRMAMRAVSGR